MGGRKRKRKNLKSGTYIVGEGITELHYFRHIKKLYDYNFKVQASLFKNTSIYSMRRKVNELLSADIKVICVFDSDVAHRQESEKKALENFRKEYVGNRNVLLCDSLPSIEYWFFLHFKNQQWNNYDSTTAKRELAKHIQGYQTTEHFLENEAWVKSLSEDGKLEQAKINAENYKQGGGSHTNVYKAFYKFQKA